MFEDKIQQVRKAETISYTGKIENIVGMSIEASGGRAAVGDICQIYNGESGGQVLAEVVGFKNDRMLLMPYSDMSGISSGNFVRNTGRRLSLMMGAFLKGRVINALGQPIDGKGPFHGGTSFCVERNQYINPMSRPPIRERMEFGVKAIDSMLTIGKGQRIGIFAGSGVGKSTLMGMIAKNVKADINVIALVGERGREVLEFMEKDLGEEGMRRSILVVATSDQPAMLRKQCPSVATGIAEYFRDQGCHVLLMMDSLTRFAMAQREIGLAVGEPPVARGYTPSIYAELPKLQECVRQVRHAGAKANSSCGIHVHVDAANHNRQSLKNLIGIMYSKEDILFKALQVNESRASRWCQKVREPMLKQARRLSSDETRDLTQLENIWYEGDNGSADHYNWTRYYALNLHSVFYRGTVEWRCFNSTLHAGKVAAYVNLCLAISAQAIAQRSTVMRKTHSDNELFTFRVWLVRLGLNGEEFKHTRDHLLANLDGDRAWRFDKDSYAVNKKKKKSREMER